MESEVAGKGWTSIADGRPLSGYERRGKPRGWRSNAKSEVTRMRRDEYVDHFRYWFGMIDRDWDDRKGLYVWADAGGGYVILTSTMLPCLAVMGLEGDRKLARRIPRIIEHLLATPPWDPEYHYWNQSFDRLGMEPHAGVSWIGSHLALAYLYRKELDLPSDLLEKAMDVVQLWTARMAEFARDAGEMPFNCYIDQKGEIADPGAIRRAAIIRGEPEDLRWLREGGPSNQLIEQQTAALAYLATRREVFWEHVRDLWGRIIERQENGKPILFRSCIDPDYSFIYANDPEGCVHTHRYTQSVYALNFVYWHAEAVRIARRVGRSELVWEEMVRRYAQALFGRALLADGTLNMALNAYGWERSVATCYLRAYYLHPLIPLADLAPFTAGQLVAMLDASLKALRALAEKGQAGYFPPVLGLKGFHRGPHTPWDLAFMLAEMILTNKEAMDVRQGTGETPRCYSGFAWSQKHFVMQTPSYSLTVVGAGTPYFEQKGQLGLGMIATGGEYVLKIPNGPFLTPLSDVGRALFYARAGGEEISSTDVHFFNREDYDFRMEVILPDGTRISRGEDFGPLPYDPMLENLSLEVSFGKGGSRLMRRFDLSAKAVTVTDSIEALDEVKVEHCFTRLPVITVDHEGHSVVWKGVAGGRAVEIKPPCHMGYEGEIAHTDQDFIQSLPDLERQEVTYHSGHGFTFEQLEKTPVRLAISRGEWQENRRMRVDGKNFDYYWIDKPVMLSKGERRTFSYQITPTSTKADRGMN